MQLFEIINNDRQWASVFSSQQSLLEICDIISNRKYVRREKLLQDWCSLLASKEYLSCEGVGIVLYKNGKKQQLKRVCFFSHRDQQNGGEIYKEFPSETFDDFFAHETFPFHILTKADFRKLSEHFPYDGIKHALLIKIVDKKECIGYVELYNQIKRTPKEIVISDKGFNWLKLNPQKKTIQPILSLFRSISQKIGYSLIKLQNAEIVKDYVADLINIKDAQKKNLYTVIRSHLVSFTGASHLTIWIYDKDNEIIMLNYLYGQVKKLPTETVLLKNDSWLGCLIKSDKNIVSVHGGPH